MPYRDPQSPNWSISYSNSSGKRVRESAGTSSFEEAKALEAKRKLESHFIKRWGEKPTHSYDQMMVEYLRETVEKKSHSRDLTSANALQPHFSGKIMQKLQPIDVAEYKKLRRSKISATGKRISDSTIGKELMLVSAAIKYVNRELGWEIPNILTGRIPLGRIMKVRWLRHEEADELVFQAKNSSRAKHLVHFIELGLSTGMRRDEMLRLEWSRVDFGQRLIYLEPDDQKSGIPGSIPLNETALSVLRARLEHRMQWCTDSPWVFAGRTGERIGSIKNSFYYAAAAVGLNDISPHTLRHTFAAWLVQAGVPIRTVCELCRHKDIRTTMRYAHLAPENSREAIKVLDRRSEFGQSELSDLAVKIS